MMEGSREWLAGVWSLDDNNQHCIIDHVVIFREVNESPISKTHILIYFILVPNALVACTENLSHIIAWRWVR